MKMKIQDYLKAICYNNDSIPRQHCGGNAVLPREGTQRSATALGEKLLQRKNELRTLIRGVPLLTSRRYA